MDLFLLSSGVGFQNRSLEPEIELNTARTNVEGFIRMVTTAFHHFKKTGGGHIAVISSIAGTKGLGVAPAYSATKRFQNTYIDALAQLSRMQRLNRSAAKRQVPNADACRQSGAMHRPVIGTEKKNSNNRQALSSVGILLADDSALVVGTVAYKKLISYLHAKKPKTPEL